MKYETKYINPSIKLSEFNGKLFKTEVVFEHHLLVWFISGETKIIQADATLLANFNEPGKINLADFMERHYMFNMPLDKYSYLTGRSLATFRRDFKKIYNTTPQKWLTGKRLQLAHYQIAEKQRKPNDVYIEAGFENLSHFSFAFKNHFGYPPNNLRAK
jgi:AraC-like DNA-binding protein